MAPAKPLQRGWDGTQTHEKGHTQPRALWPSDSSEGTAVTGEGGGQARPSLPPGRAECLREEGTDGRVVADESWDLSAKSHPLWRQL